MKTVQLGLLALASARVVYDVANPQIKLVVNDPASLGVDTVAQYSGYLETQKNNKLFYWFFESRNNPETDPVVLWMNGGPGCSSMAAVLFENGPQNIGLDGNFTVNPFSFNNNASVIYLDQPVGVGFSKGTAIVSSTQQAAKDFTSFLRLFFDEFAKYAANQFHIVGESYAGIYVPVFAKAVLDEKDRKYQLNSIALGNGLVNLTAQYNSYQPMLCGHGGAPPVLGREECNRLDRSTGPCLSASEQCINSGRSYRPCAKAEFRCSALNGAWGARDPYDIRRKGRDYPHMDLAAQWLDQPEVKEALGVEPSLEYKVCNNEMLERFVWRRDSYVDAPKLVNEILAAGVPVLGYYGDKDIICNWLSGREWMRELQWEGQEEFGRALETPNDFVVNNKSMGQVSNFGNFTFLRVYDSGHFVPFNQPEAASEMLVRWLGQDYGLLGDTDAR